MDFFRVSSLQRERDYRTVAQKWTCALALLFRLSGVISHYDEVESQGVGKKY
jgi:hypothetical protein